MQRVDAGSPSDWGALEQMKQLAHDSAGPGVVACQASAEPDSCSVDPASVGIVRKPISDACVQASVAHEGSVFHEMGPSTPRRIRDAAN